MALLDDELAPDLPPLPEGFRLVEPRAARRSVAVPARPKPSLPPLPEGFRLVEPSAAPKAATPAAVVAEEGGFLDSAINIAKGAGERVMDIAGGGMRTLGAASDALRDAARAGAVLGAEHSGADPDEIVHLEEEMSGPSAGGAAARKQARGLEATSFGYEPGTSWEDFKASPVKNFVPFALETGLVSAPDMAAAMAALPAYVLARSGELGQQRAQNNNVDDATVGDILAVMPAAALSAILDRFGGRGMFGLDEAAVQTLKQAGKEVGKAGVKEAATEAAQEGIEYAGTHVGTEKGVDLAEAGEQMAAGAVGGGGFGAGVRAGTAGAEYVGAKASGAPQPAERSATPPLPEGFRKVENAVERAEGSGGAPAGPVTDERASPPATPSPAAISGEMREILRRAGNTDDMIDAMSAEEAEAEAGQYRAVTPSAAVQGTPTPARPADNVGIAPATPQERKEVLSELPVAPPLSTRGGAPGLSTRRGLATDASRGRPAEIEKAPDLDIAGQRVNTEPSDAQKEAGNYKKAHIRVAGFDITIENPKGSTRRGRDPQGGEWESVLPAHYGYLKRTIGADGDHVDVYVGDNPTSKKIYIVDQKANSPQGRFDEHKVILGANSIAEARDLYVRAFNDGSGNQRLGAITAVTPKALRDFLASPQSARSAYRMGKERLTEAGFPADTQGRTKRPPSLTEFIAAAGGIRDHGGELAAMDAGKIFLPGVGKLVRQNGRTLDQARALAVENGYLQDAAAGEQSTSTVDDLLVALRDDIGSYRHFSTYDDDWAGAWRDEQAAAEGARREEGARARAEVELDEIGLTRDADPQFYDRALEMVMEGMDAADAIERAAIQVNASENFVADDTPATPYFFDEEPTDAVQRGATPESGPAVSAEGAGGARPEEARSPVEGSEPPQDRGEGGAQEEPDYDRALDAALDSEFPPLPEGFRLVEPGAEGKPQSVFAGAERISQAEEAQRAADKPLRSKAPQKDVGGLFGDDSKQTDLMDLPGAKAIKPPATVYHGTSSGGFDTFDTYGGKYGLFGSGGYFTEDPDIALEYTRKGRGDQPTVYSAKLTVKNPLDMDAPADAAAWQAAFDDYLDPATIPANPTNEQMYREVEEMVAAEMIPDYEGAEIMQGGIMGMGYDAITHIGGGRHKSSKGTKHRVWIVFDPEQVSDLKPQATVKTAAKSAAMGIEEVTKGLSTLFGGAKLSSGLTFDDETYQKALPFFRAGVAHFADAGRDVAEMAKRLVRHLAQNGMDRDAIERMRPYLVRFMKDWREGIEKPNLNAAEKAPEKAQKPAETAENVAAEPASSPVEKVNTPSVGAKNAHTEAAADSRVETQARKGVEAEKAAEKAETIRGDGTVLEKLRDRLIGGEPFATINQARKFLLDNGWTAKDEAVSNKEAEELIEHAVVLAARDIVKAGKARGPGVVFDRLVGLYERQPRLATRTSQSMAEQAYSTPAPIAYVASRLARVANADSVLEPAAGNGMLLIEANPKAVDANEINRARADALASQGFSVSTNDATEPGLSADPVDVVITNPPFGAVRSGGESTVYDINGHRTTAIDQAIALNALQHMKDDGRAVLIVGSVKPDLSPEARSDAYNTSQKRKFYKRLYDNYNVTQHFTVDGKLYQKQGAAWPVDVIVIEGKGKSAYPYPAARVPAIVGSWEELKGYIDGSSRPESADGRAERVPVEGGSEVSRPAPAGGRSDAGDRGRGRPADGGRPSVHPARPERQPEAGSVSDDRGQREPDGNLDGDPRPEPLAGSGDASGAYNRVAPRERASRLTETNDKGQVPYRPYSHEGTKLNTLVPRALGDAMDASLAKVEQQHGDIDHFVAQSLGYDVAELKDVFSAEQIDAVALAIDNVAKGDAFIIGDQTGIGKGRVVAAAIRFAHRRGMVPVFVTEKPDLYGDMYRDLADIRWAKSLGRDPNIYMTNANTTVPLDDEAVEWVIERDEAKADGRKLPPRRGQFTKAQSPADAEKRMREILAGTFKPDVVFTTYDQMNTVKGEETPRRRFMDAVAPRAFLIMDESHNAGGQGAKGNARAAKDGPIPRSKKFREWLGNAKAAMYSSATYAKNPTVMDLYSRTDMAKAVDDIEELPELIAKGRVPLQQVVASMLADAGQYARRERSFEGVEYALDVADVDKENYAAFASAIRSIFKFDRAVSEFRKEWIDTWLKENAASMAMDSAVGDIAANSTEFSSIMHNLVNQMLLAIKAEAAAQRALKSLEDGEKPVVALSFTNESFLSDYAADHGTEIGDDLGLTFRDMLQRYLDRALRITLKTDDDQKMHVFIPVADLPGYQRQMFDEAQEMVRTADVGGLPISPIDHIRHRLKEAGYRVAEITGRSTMIDYGHETPRYAERPRNEQGATGKRATIKKYNDGQLDAVILNRSGSTGVSMHSSSKYKDQRRRRMILAQAEGNIDTHMQMLGRVHRTGQVTPPAYTQLAADIPAEARPTAVLMKKMASLSANTTASRKSNFTADAVDFMNEYGDLAAVQWAKDNADLNYDMGEPVRFDDKGKLTTENPMQRLTGRIMLLDPDQQQDMLDALTQTYNMILAQKEALGENVLEATALDLEAEKIGTTVMKPALGPSPFQASADLDTYRVKAPGRAMKPRDVIDAVMDSVGGDRPTSWEFARALLSLQRRGQTKAEDLIRRTSDEFQSYRKWVIDGVKDAEKKQKAGQDAQAMWDHWTGVVRRAPVGAQVILVSGDNETPAIVTGVVKSKRKANSPVQLSTWSVRFAIPDDSRELQLPFTQILLAPDKDADGIEIRAAGWSDRLDNLEKRFEQASTVGHEERVIATGNILAAFDQLQGKGRIIQFTDKEGATRPGIMMPRGYSAAVYEAERQVRFKDAAQTMRFLKESDGKRITDERENIEVSNTYEGFNFDINASRLKGGRYFTDDTVRKIYDKWTKYGNQMQATVDEATARRLIEAMQKLGAKFVASSEQEFAQKIVYPNGGVPKDAQFQVMEGGQTETPAFKRWFGDSKVVDAVGRPLVVYHGTQSDSDFSKFNTPTHFGTKQQANDIASSFRLFAPSAARGESPRVLPVYLKIENPIRISDTGANHTAMDYIEALRETGDLEFFQYDQIIHDDQDNYIDDDAVLTQRLVDHLEDRGYDGFVYANEVEGQGDSYVAFHPEQIKSAIGNRGTFDPNDPRINAQPAEAPSGWDSVDGGYQATKLTPVQVLEVAAIVQRVAGIDTQFRDAIVIPGTNAALRQWGQAGRPAEVAGFYSATYDDAGQFVRDIIAISMRTPSGPRTAYHEAFHRLQGLFLNEQERRLLLSQKEMLKSIVASRRGEDTASVMSQKELEAEAFAIWSDAMDNGGADGIRLHIGIRRAWAKLMQAIQRVRNYLRGQGFQTLDDVFETARSGRMKDRAMGTAPADGATYYQPAWHGTPHRFDRFSTEKIGTGEGAQAYGWGLYFAGKREVAEHYRDTLSQRQSAVEVDGELITVTKRIGETDAIERAAIFAEQALDAGVSLDNKAREIDMRAREADHGDLTAFQKEGGWDDAKTLREAANILRDWSGKTVKKGGKLYKVEVPNDDELMLWDAPMSEQPEGVREKLHAAQFAHKEAHADQTGAQIYAINARDLGSDQAASEALRAAGIPGHKYADGQSRVQGLRILSPKDSVSGKWVVGQAPNGPNQYFDNEADARAAYQKIRDEQTYNYVIYDDSRVEITDQFQLMPTAEELARVPASTPPSALPGALVTQRINRALRAGTTLAKKTFKDDRRTVGDDEGAGDYVTRKMVDYLLPVLRMQQKVSTKLSELMDPYLNARVAEDGALAEMMVMEETYLKPMVESLASGGVYLEDFHKYLYALHVEERNEVVGLRHKPDSELFKAIDNHDLKGASGWSTNEAKAVLAEAKGDPERWRALRQAGAYMRAYIDVDLRKAKSRGLISEETYDLLTTQWKNYVPMKGQDGMDDDGFWRPGAGGFDVRGQEHKTAMGRFSEAENVIAHAVTQVSTSILRQHKNTVGKAMLRFINQFDPAGEDIAEVYWAGKDGFGDIEKADDVWKRRIGRDGKVEWYRVPNPFASRDDVLATKVGGKTYWIKFHDPKVGLALRKLSKTEISGISKIMRPITVWQSIVNTRANPAFTPINIIRDVLTGSVHLLDENFNVGQVAGIVKNIPKAWGGLWRQIRGTAGDAEWDRLAREYMDAGGRITFHGYADLEKTLKNLQREVTQAIEGKSPMRKAWDALTGFIGQINDVGENGIRLAAYAAARKQGRTAKESAFMARDLTVDFKKHGDWGQEFNSWFVFFNAALQGNVNIVTRMVRSKYVRRAVASFVFVGLMEHFWNSLMAGDDDDGESYYRKMLINEPWKLERQFVFFIPNSGGKYVSFPMPYGYNAFHHMGVQAGAVMSGDKGALPATLDVLRVYFDAFNPIGSGDIAGMISPTISDPIVDLWRNKNFAGNPIYPDDNTFDKSPDPASGRSFSTTPWPFKTTAEWLNWLSGGDSVMPGAMDYHPDALEHLWGYATGGLGRFLVDAGSAGTNALGGEFKPKATPWVKNFYGEIDVDSHRTEYFRERERVLAAEGYLKKYQESGDAKNVQWMYDNRAVEIEAISAFKAAEKQRRAINKERRRVEAAQMPEAQRTKALEALAEREAEAMRMARTAFSRAEGQ